MSWNELEQVGYALDNIRNIMKFLLIVVDFSVEDSEQCLLYRIPF